MSENKITAWINVGYELLGSDGLEGMKVERLARMLKLNKSGFYYYFGSMQSFVKGLLEHHVAIAKVISDEMATCNNFDPDLLMVIVRHKNFFLVESHLLVGSKACAFDGDFDAASRILLPQLLPLWRKSSGQDFEPATALAYLNMIRHFFYSRIDQAHINYEHLHNLTAETRGVLAGIRIEPRMSLSRQGQTSSE